MIEFRRVGWATMRRPSGDGLDVWGVYGTRPGQLALYSAGWRDNDGTWHPNTREWLEKFGHRFWGTRDWYGLLLDDHQPEFDELGLVRCSCGWSKRRDSKGLAELEFEAHTSNIRPTRK